MNRFLTRARTLQAEIQTEIDGLLERASARIDAERSLARSANPSATVEAIEAQVPEALNADEQTALDELRGRRSPIDEQVDRLEALEARQAAAPRGSAARVISEPTTYGRGADHSFFRDLARALEPSTQDPAARQRLQRHTQEMNVEAEARADMSRADGTGGEFVPPMWLVDQYIALARAGRVCADLCRRMPLPGGTDQINLPVVSTGTTTAGVADLASPSNTPMTTTSVNAGVKTVAGQQKFAMQLLDQSPINFDEVVFADLMADHAVRTDSYVIKGGGGNNHSGILDLGSPVAVTYTDASPTPGELYPKIADAIQQIHTLRFLPAQAILMHPRRWAFHTGALDANGRPLVVPNEQGPQNAFAGMTDVRSQGAVGSLQGLPVYTDPNIPTNLGGGTNEDRVILARFDDLYLWEGALRTRTLFETDADTLEVRLQLWNYQAFMAGRYPKAVAVISGTGLATPTF